MNNARLDQIKEASKNLKTLYREETKRR